MEEIEQLHAILKSWEVAIQLNGINPQLSEHLNCICSVAPIESITLQFLHRTSKTLKLVATVGGDSRIIAESTSIVCSEKKWLSLNEWCRSGQLIRQIGNSRSGKLSFLTPSSITNSVVAIPLRPSASECRSEDVTLGVAIFEIGSNRALRESQYSLLARWQPMLWLTLDRFIRSLWPDERSDEPSSDLNKSGNESVDVAREAIVGSESGLRAVMERVQIVAPSDMPVLILGETGTGKEVVARAIHSRSPRHSKPFIRVNCGAIPTELIDSQLFGHERGSFTGASDQRRGWFERADGGTLFLDEIGELPLAAQVRLLRVLQEHQIERVGGQENIHVDVRIVAATHRDLSFMVHQRTFREDLWYRINMFPILLPGLRERVEDIPSLTRHFARRAANRFGLQYVEPSQSDVKLLMDYRWPGNIRELQAVIDRAVILGGGSHLDVGKSLGNTFIQPVFRPQPSDEPTYYEVIPESIVATTIPVHSESGSDEEDAPVDSLDSAIVRHIERALAVTGGQIEGGRGAAKLLGINPHTLRAKMRKLKIDWDRFRRF